MPIRVFNWDRQGKFLDPEAAIAAGRSGKPGAEAATTALVNILSFLNESALQYRVKQEFEGIISTAGSTISSWADSNPTNKCYDPGDVGALIHLITSVGTAPIAMKPPVSFVDMFIGDCGLDSSAVITKYIGTPGYYPTGGSNTTTRWSFFWYTV
jgi:hypothetical protein